MLLLHEKNTIKIIKLLGAHRQNEAGIKQG